MLVTFPCGVLGQVLYLIVSIPDLCLLPYVENHLEFIFGLLRQHTISSHYQPTSKTPYEWRFAGGPMVAQFYMHSGSAWLIHQITSSRFSSVLLRQLVCSSTRASLLVLLSASSIFGKCSLFHTKTRQTVTIVISVPTQPRVAPRNTCSCEPESSENVSAVMKTK